MNERERRDLANRLAVAIVNRIGIMVALGFLAYVSLFQPELLQSSAWWVDFKAWWFEKVLSGGATTEILVTIGALLVGSVVVGGVPAAVSWTWDRWHRHRHKVG